MQKKKSQLALIHIAKKQLNLDDTAYRAILSGAGITSAKDIENDNQFNTIMAAFKELGFKSTSRYNWRQNTVSGTPGMISKKQEYYIKGLWALASRVKDEASLRKIIKRIGKVDNISFLPRRAASAVILALRDICWKAGFNPDTKEVINVPYSKASGANFMRGNSPCVLSPDDGGDRINPDRQNMAFGAGSCG